MNKLNNCNYFLCIKTLEDTESHIALNQFINSLTWYDPLYTSSSTRTWTNSFFNGNVEPNLPSFKKGEIYKEENGWIFGFNKCLSIDDENVPEHFIKLDIEIDDEAEKIYNKINSFCIPFSIIPVSCMYDENTKNVSFITYLCAVYPITYMFGMESKNFYTTDLKMGMKFIWRKIRTYGKYCAIVKTCLKGDYYRCANAFKSYKIEKKYL